MSQWRKTKAGIYLRVSSEEQRERQTIRTQREFAETYCELHGLEIFNFYVDDGVSGTVPLHERPGGAQALRDAQSRNYDVLLGYKIDRFARSARLILNTVEELASYGVGISSMTESIDTSTPAGRMQLTMLSAFAGFERDTFLERSAHGTARAAAEGRPLGGIVPYGYLVEGKKQLARWAIDETKVWGDWTAADVVRWIYERLGVDRWSCRQVADELNARGVPTAYQRAGRGTRTKKTAPRWRASRIRNLVTNPIYCGRYQYGRRSTNPDRAVIEATMPALVSEELWQAAQDTLRFLRFVPKDGSPRINLLRGLMVCGICGLHFCGARGRDKESTWYRCNGQTVDHGPIAGRCVAKSIKAEWIEPLVWADIKGWLRDPGAVLEELSGQAQHAAERVAREAERQTLAERLSDLAAQRERVLDLHIRGHLDAAEVESRLHEITGHYTKVETQFAALCGTHADADQPWIAPDLLADLRARLDEGFDAQTRQQIARLLVKQIIVHTRVDERGKKTASLTVTYRFPNEPTLGVDFDCTDTDSWRRPAATGPGWRTGIRQRARWQRIKKGGQRPPHRILSLLLLPPVRCYCPFLQWKTTTGFSRRGQRLWESALRRRGSGSLPPA
jgi:site-specific DNA recombinase